MGHHPGNKYMVRTEAIPMLLLELLKALLKREEEKITIT